MTGNSQLWFGALVAGAEVGDHVGAGADVLETDRAIGCVDSATICVGTGGGGTVGVTTTEGTLVAVGVIEFAGSTRATAGVSVRLIGARVTVPTITGVIPTGWVGGANVTVDLSLPSSVGAGAGLVRVGTVPPRPGAGPGDALAVVP